jgi:hypothetical protein
MLYLQPELKLNTRVHRLFYIATMSCFTTQSIDRAQGQRPAHFHPKPCQTLDSLDHGKFVAPSCASRREAAMAWTSSTAPGRACLQPCRCVTRSRSVRCLLAKESAWHFPLSLSLRGAGPALQRCCGRPRACVCATGAPQHRHCARRSGGMRSRGSGAVRRPTPRPWPPARRSAPAARALCRRRSPTRTASWGGA